MYIKLSFTIISLGMYAFTFYYEVNLDGFGLLTNERS